MQLLPFPPMPDIVPLGEVKQLEVVHQFEEPCLTGWAIVAAAEAADYDEDETEELYTAAAFALERSVESILNDYRNYAYARIMLRGHLTTVYVFQMLHRRPGEKLN